MKPRPPRIEEAVRLAHDHRRLGDLAATRIARELLEDAEADLGAVLEIAAVLPADLARHLRERALRMIAMIPRPTPARRKATKVAKKLRIAHRPTTDLTRPARK